MDKAVAVTGSLVYQT